MLRKESLSLIEAEKRLGSDELRFAMGYSRKAGWVTIDNGGLKITLLNGETIEVSRRQAVKFKIKFGF